MIINYDNEETIRLDIWLSEHTGRSRSFIKTCYKNDQIRVNDKKVKPSFLLKEGDVINLDLQEQPIDYPATDIPLNIVFEDEHIIVINKQSGLTVHPGAGNPDNTVVNALLHYGKALSDIGGLDRPGIVHRLDKDTSGLMVIAKHNQAHEKLAKLFEERKVEKKYLALLHGYLQKEHDTINEPIARMKSNYKKMCVDKLRGKDSITEYHVLKEANEKTLAEVTLHTGRTHQIRVHFAHFSHPVVGDSLYGRATRGKSQLLHSYSLKFEHPISGEMMEFKTELPKWGKF